MQILSNGVYTSIEHRATVNAAKERISMAMFFNPKSSAQIKPATSLINPHNPPLFKQISMEKYFKDFFSRKLDGKWYIKHLKIKKKRGRIHYLKPGYMYMVMFNYGMLRFGGCMDPRNTIALRLVVLFLSHYVRSCPIISVKHA